MARLFLLFIVSFLLPGATYSQPSKTTKEKNEKPTAYSVLYNAGYKFFETLDPGYIAPNNKEIKIEPKIKIKNKKKIIQLIAHF